MFFPKSMDAAALDFLDKIWLKLTDVLYIRESDGKWQLERQLLKSHLVIVVAGGQGQLSVDGKVHSLASEHVWVCSPGQCVEATLFSFEKKGGVYLFAFHMGFTTQWLNEGLPEQPICLFPVVGSASVSIPAVIALCRTIGGLWLLDDKLQRFRSQAAFHELLCCMLQEQLPVQEGNLTSMIQKAKAYIEEHYQEPISFEKLANEAGISSRHFRRLFKNLYGKSTVDYLTELRMNHARRLMAKPDIQLWEVAQDAGYNDESHFRRAFKSHVGISPALYLKNHQMKVAAYSWPNIGMVLPLHIIPFAAPIDHYWTDYYRNKYGFDVKVQLGHDYELNRKSLQLARPDRIIAIDDFLPAREQEILSHIAPVLFIPWRSTDWREHLHLTAAFLEKKDEAVAWLKHFDHNQKLINEQVKYLVQREKVLICMIDRKNMYQWGKKYEGTALFHNLPLTPARHLDQIESSYESTTVMQLAKQDGDRILMMISEDGASQATWQTVQNSEEWQKMKAVKIKQVHHIWIGPWYEYSAFNHDLIQKQTFHMFDLLSM